MGISSGLSGVPLPLEAVDECWDLLDSDISCSKTCRRVLPTSKGVVTTEAKAPLTAPAIKLSMKNAT